jgi:hypothetical protein
MAFDKDFYALNEKYSKQLLNEFGLGQAACGEGLESPIQTTVAIEAEEKISSTQLHDRLETISELSKLLIGMTRSYKVEPWVAEKVSTIYVSISELYNKLDLELIEKETPKEENEDSLESGYRPVRPG